MNPFNRSPQGAPHPEAFPLGSQESRAAARAMLETNKKEPKLDIMEILREGRRRMAARLWRPRSAEEYTQEAERLRKTARPGDELARQLIHA
jgi:hypothetical protein